PRVSRRGQAAPSRDRGCLSRRRADARPGQVRADARRDGAQPDGSWQSPGAGEEGRRVRARPRFGVSRGRTVGARFRSPRTPDIVAWSRSPRQLASPGSLVQPSRKRVHAMSEAIDETRLNDLIGKVIGDVAGAMSLFMAYLGDQAGVFAALDGAGRLTLDELAAKTGLNPKYLREWLGSVSAAGYVNYHAEDETFSITPEQALV